MDIPMSRLWKSQELFGPAFGTSRGEEVVRLSVALDASAEHKLPDMACGDLPEHRFPTQGVNKQALGGNASSSPFSGSLPVLTDDILAAYQEQCIREGSSQASPAFSLALPSLTPARPPSLDSSLQRPCYSPSHNDPVFSLSDLTPTQSSTVLSATPSSLSGPLRASTGALPSLIQKTCRRTRSHFYALGEAPIVASGSELIDDDESSDDEAVETSSDRPAPTHFWGKGFQTSASTGPLLKSSPPLPTRATPKMRSVDEEIDLPESPPTRPTSTLRASTATLPSTTFTHYNTPRELPLNNPVFDPSALATRSPVPASFPPFVHNTQGLPEASHTLAHLTLQPPPPNGPDTEEYLREREWKTLENSHAMKFSLDSLESLCSVSARNSHKNRYAEILALDATRVKLSSNEAEDSDYINASFVRGAGSSRYISAQAPIPATYGDFWRMVWEQKIPVIVMLTRLIESGCPKAHKYWPTSKTRVYGDKFKVTLVNRTESTDYDYRVKEFEIECDGERRRLFQFQYIGWPDHGVPSSPESLLRMIAAVNEHMDEIRACPCVEGPSPRVYEYPSQNFPDGRSSLNSSTSGSVKSANERLDDTENGWSFGPSLAGSALSNPPFSSGRHFQAPGAAHASGSLHLGNSVTPSSAHASDASLAVPRIRRCSSSQLSHISGGTRSILGNNGGHTALNQSLIVPATGTPVGASHTSSVSNAPAGGSFTHYRHESSSAATPTRDSILNTDNVSSNSSRSASQLTTRFGMHPGNPMHNGNSTTQAPIMSKNSSSASLTSSFSTYSSPEHCFGQMTSFGCSSSMNGEKPCQMSTSPTSSSSLLSSYSSTSSTVTSSSTFSNSSSSTISSSPYIMASSSGVSVMSASSTFQTNHMMSGTIPTPSHLSIPSSSSPHGSSFSPSPIGSAPSPVQQSPPLAHSQSQLVSNQQPLSKPVPCPAKGHYVMGPLLVHCSAGIGRSGAFILIHSVLDKLQAEGKLENDINLCTLLEDMRSCRTHLVPHQMQYNFCYQAIDYYLCYKNLKKQFGTEDTDSSSSSSGRQKMRMATLQRSPLNRSSHVIPNFESDIF